MSVAVRRALYGKMAADVTLVALLGIPATGYTKSIYHQFAPEGAGFPYIVFNKESGNPSYGFGGRALDDELWLIKGVDRPVPPSTSTDAVENIASRLDALLTDGAISISGYTQRWLRREMDVEYPEEIDGVAYRHAGAQYRLIYR